MRRGAPVRMVEAALLAVGLAAGCARPGPPPLALEHPVACPPARLPRDTSMDTIWAWVPYQGWGESAAEANFRIDQALAALRFLPRVPVLAGDSESPGQRPRPIPALDGLDDATSLVWFQVRNNGRLDGLSLERWSGWVPLDRALERAVLRADSARALEALPDSLQGEGIDLWLAASTTRLANAMNLPVGYVAAVHYAPPVVVRRPRLRHLGSRLTMPAVARQVGIGDSLMVGFDVDSTGRVEPRSIRFEHVTWREFADEALRILHAARFYPGTLDGCPIAMHVVMPIDFVVGGEP